MISGIELADDHERDSPDQASWAGNGRRCLRSGEPLWPRDPYWNRSIQRQRQNLRQLTICTRARNGTLVYASRYYIIVESQMSNIGQRGRALDQYGNITMLDQVCVQGDAREGPLVPSIQ